MEDSNTRLLRYLNDSYASEMGGLVALRDLVVMAEGTPEIHQALEQHLQVSESQAERLRDRILALGGDKSEPKAMVNSLIAKGSALVNSLHNREDKLTQDLIKMYAFERFEMGAYLALRTYSETINDEETALLATQLIDEEKLASDMLERLIPLAALQSATAAESDMSEAGESKSHFAVPPAAFLIPGAILAAWGVSKWLGSRSSAANRFATATNMMEPEYAGASVAVLDASMSGMGGEGTPFYSEHAYVPLVLEETVVGELPVDDLPDRE